MTTIAYDGEILAADTRAVGNWIVQCPVQKIFLNDTPEADYIAFGFAGRFVDVQPMMEWASGNERDPAEFPNTDGSTLLAVHKDGTLHRFLDGPVPEPSWAKRHAEGSGSEFAMGALMMGASAIEAIEVAMSLDPGSGGKVMWINIKTGENNLDSLTE